MASYILIHGAWHASWCWGGVGELLSGQGHQVIAPDLPGHGDNVKLHSEVKFQDYIDCILGCVRRCHEPPVVVGHSFAGMFLSQLAADYRDQIKKFIYVTAYVPLSGESFLRMSEKFSATPLSSELIVDKEKCSIFLKGENLSGILYNCASSEKQVMASSKVENEPLMPFATPVKLSDFSYSDVDTHYIFCEQDQALKLSDQQWMAERTQGKTSFLPCDHSPFLSMPEALVLLLTQ
jgi:pimeloyl-ACP methyl ester carboxylesterase